jgi:DNA mismatch repair protein MutS
LLQKELTAEENKAMTLKQNTNMCKISNATLKKYSNELITLRETFFQKVKAWFKHYLQLFCGKYQHIFESLRQFVESIDIAQSNVKCKRLYNYCKPEVVRDTESFMEATGMRHPIIERINNSTAYVPNDIALNQSQNGMVLYALNSCGKSSLLRSIGLCVIMAQCGLYVPCATFRYAPFDTIVTQVELYDNLWKSQSSFITEMVGLRKILKLANERCLVLSDELTKGTEVVSATSIFAASVLELLKRRCKFIFTTHLQDVAKIESIKTHPNLQICHLSVDIVNDNIIFERKLREGPCSELYGLEVASAVGLDKELLNASFAIRNALMNKSSEVLKTKRSRYNTHKLLDACEICGYSPLKDTDIPLDTHHIKFQCSADKNDFTGHFHKHSVFNLVCLCKKCHIDVHNNIYSIDGYVETTSGRQLKYFKTF